MYQTVTKICGALLLTASSMSAASAQSDIELAFDAFAFDDATAQVAQLDLSLPEEGWEPAPIASARAFEIEVDGLGRVVRPEDPGAIGATLGGLKSELLRN